MSAFEFDGDLQADVVALRLTLLNNGYIPVPVNGKATRLPKWQSINVTPDTIRSWATRQDEPNTGIRCDSLAGVDVDVLDEVLAAQLVNLAITCLGTTLQRIGMAPKQLLPYRVTTPIRKIATPALILPGGKNAKVEVLAQGQQFVANGIHPDTQQPYCWLGKSPLDVPFAALPEVGEEKLQQFVTAAEAILRAAGGKTKKELNGAASKPPSDRPSTASRPNGEHPPTTRDDVEDALRAVPNHHDWDGWVKIGGAIYDALADDGEDLFISWSAQSPKNDEATTRAKWRSYRTSPMTSVSSNSLFWEARQAGWKPKRERATERLDELRSAGERPAALHDDDIPVPQRFTENALAYLFTAEHPDLIYVHEWGKWMRYDAGRWHEDHAVTVFDAARAICAREGNIAIACLKKGGANVAGAINKASTVAAIERLARHHHKHARAADLFNADRMKLNSPNDTLNCEAKHAAQST